jgi:hypothetical protein
MTILGLPKKEKFMTEEMDLQYYFTTQKTVILTRQFRLPYLNKQG